MVSGENVNEQYLVRWNAAGEDGLNLHSQFPHHSLGEKAVLQRHEVIKHWTSYWAKTMESPRSENSILIRKREEDGERIS